MKLLTAFLCALWGSSGSAEAAQKPNFIVILADDLGYGDLACYGGGGVATPHLDRMAREGAKFTSLYVAQGYATTIIGKWHLGNQDMFQPLNHGFDTWYGTPASNSQGFDPATKKYAKDCVWLEDFRQESILKLKEAPFPLVRDNVVVEVPADRDTGSGGLRGGRIGRRS